MANQKISALNSATTTDGTEVLPVVQSAETKKMAVSVIKDWLLGLTNLWSRAQTIQPSQAETALTVRRATSGQTEDILMVQAQDNTVLARFDKDGKITAPTLIGSSGTLTASAPVLDVTQTWNASGVTFTGLKANFTDTASASGSLLMDLQVGGASRFSVNKAGTATATALNTVTLATTGACNFQNLVLTVRDNIVKTWNGGSYNWASTGGSDGPTDLSLFRDVADTLAQRRGVNAQTFRLYNTFTDASNYERAKIQWDTNVLKIGTEKAGTGTARALELQTDGVTRLTIAANGFVSSSGSISAGSNLQATGIVSCGSTHSLRVDGRLGISSASDGVARLANNNGDGFSRLQFGGGTSSFPAIKRDTTSLQARLADDSAFTNIQGKLTTEANAVAETPTATHTLTIYDASGIAYKVLAVAA